MRPSAIFGVVLLIFISEVSGYTCPRTNKRPGSVCVDECLRSLGCADPNKDCICDGDCGFSCVKKSLLCRTLTIRNGQMVGKKRTFNSTVRFQCNPTYTLFGSSIRTCRAKGIWDGKKSRCKIACPDPGIPDFTNRERKVNPTGFPAGTSLVYRCLPGYKTTDSLRLDCQKNGQWTSSPPVCKVQQCGRVTLPSNTIVRIPRRWRNKASYQLGTRILLKCKPGYSSEILIGLMICRARGWRLMQPRYVCKAKSCGNPGTPRNGKKNGLSYGFNDVVRYSCDSCYELDGASYRRCLSHGRWSDRLPTCSRVLCPKPRPLTHGSYSLSSQPIYCGSFVTYSCSIGYNLKGSARRDCQSDKTWSNSEPTCEIVNCGDPGHPKNGLTKARGGFTYGNDVTFSCLANYVLQGSLLATCESDGRWSKRLPTCLEKCSDPSGSTNARVIGDHFYHGKQVEFVCSGAYTLVPRQSRTLSCEDGEWKGQIPTCKASCPRLRQPYRGTVSARSLIHGSYVQFRCYRGYQLVGASRLSCNDGRWSSQPPRCLAICVKIQSLSNGWVSGRNYLEGDELRFRCRQDYVLEGEKAIKCTGNRRWNASKPTCNAPCRRLNAPDNGRITQQGFRHRENILFECDPSYTLRGKNVLTCFNGRWNTGSPSCLAPCKRFGAKPFRQGYIKKNGFRHNEEITFDCRNPYVIDGQNTLRCNDGRWSPRLPTCGAPCKKFSAPRNGEIVENGFKHKDKTTFACKRGYQMVGLPERLCNFGVWNKRTPPRCEAKCPDPSRSTNARVIGRQFYNGQQVEFVCAGDSSLTPQKSRKLTCLDGNWNGVIPVCKAWCPSLSKIPNGNVIVSRRTHGAVVQFVCSDGYQLVGASSARCDNGKWSEKPPICLGKCSDPSRSTNARIIGSEFYHGRQVEFVCPRDSSLVPEKSRKLTCLDGRWDGVIPVCKASCASLSKLSNGNVIGFRRTHGSVVQFECSDGYQLVGASNARCDNGKWSDKLPICSAICKEISSIVNGQVVGNGRLEGGELSFVCDENYVLEGGKVLRCESDGRWNASEPNCKSLGIPTTNPTDSAQAIRNCSAVSRPSGGRMSGSGVSPGSKRTFSCYRYFKMIGSKEITCLDNGQWSGPAPTCKIKGPVINCTVVGEIEGGYAIRNESFHGGKVIFKCNTNYTMSGRKSMLCQSGKWVRPRPKCRAPCKFLTPPKDGFIRQQSSHKHGAVIVFGCNRGYTMKGGSTLQCNDGSWNVSPPICEK